MFILVCIFSRFILMKFFIKAHIREKLKKHTLAFFVIIFLNKSNAIDFFTFFKNSITLPIKLKKGQLHYQL